MRGRVLVNTTAGAVGVDPQHSRTAIALREGMGRQIHASLVGDGRRRLVPNALGPEGAWGSVAVEGFLERAGDIATAADQLLGWRIDPWSPLFLRGLHDRLVAYLGQVSPTLRYGYQVFVCADRADTVGWNDRSEEGSEDGPPVTARSAARRYAAAGLTDVAFVQPTDALLCRWLASWIADPAASGMLGPEPRSKTTVVAVACGESWTAVTGYTVLLSEERQLISCLPGTAGRIERGCGEWTVELAREIMARCREGTGASSALALLDAILEFGAFLGTQRHDDAIEWGGPLSDVMVAPVRIRRRDRAAQEQVRLTADGVAKLVSRALPEAGPARPVIVAGGIGAVWPYITDALRQLGRDTATLWRSSEPEYDLAVGATWWPELRGIFAGNAQLGPAARSSAETGALHAPGAVAGLTAPSAGHPQPHDKAESVPSRTLEDIPPWERDE
jgi:hypothetical protein